MKPMFPAGRKLIVEDGRVTPVADDATPAAPYWVCPRLADGCSTPPFMIAACEDCRAAITYRDTDRQRMLCRSDARRICQQCAIERSRS